MGRAGGRAGGREGGALNPQGNPDPWPQITAGSDVDGLWQTEVLPLGEASLCTASGYLGKVICEGRCANNITICQRPATLWQRTESWLVIEFRCMCVYVKV